MASFGFYKVDEKKNKLRNVCRTITNLIVVIACAVIIALMFFDTQTMSGHSMDTTISNEDIVFVDKLYLEVFEPSRLDIISFTNPDGKASIKRVIGLPGETVQIKDKRIYIDGAPIYISYLLNTVEFSGLAEYEVVLEADEYFVLGDNRDSSEDSRFANVGNVHKSQITGRVWFRISPFSNMGFIS